MYEKINEEILILIKMKFDLLITESQLNMSIQDFKKAEVLYKEYKKILLGEITIQDLIAEGLL